ncbi:Small glutamine-rich tetratricopeptide repeat-containing 2 [Hyphodiscus hymeniophilus]|uniref:Small glutamine-rich tetratricopeptide repeat-containing 2 n=1 Tax=Hyphodiscus hymeniophilus TaxID=353542 RepID=A0A9P6VK99_9HELO|nr:Small glutamine-rich tetratricopeptide repeat-containing 2 [Hyphodiscus hymeniophilus]
MVLVTPITELPTEQSPENILKKADAETPAAAINTCILSLRASGPIVARSNSILNGNAIPFEPKGVQMPKVPDDFLNQPFSQQHIQASTEVVDEDHDLPEITKANPQVRALYHLFVENIAKHCKRNCACVRVGKCKCQSIADKIITSLDNDWGYDEDLWAKLQEDAKAMMRHSFDVHLDIFATLSFPLGYTEMKLLLCLRIPEFQRERELFGPMIEFVMGGKFDEIVSWENLRGFAYDEWMHLCMKEQSLSSMGWFIPVIRLALSIIDFLNTSLTDGTLTSEERESIEVATSCISESFKVDPHDATPKDSQNLLQIYGVYEKLKGKTPSGPNTNAAGETVTPKEPSEAQKKEAETLKSQGNAAMAKKDYPTAIELYSKALGLIPGNPIFLSNRAAAYSASKDHESARADAEAAVAADPKYTKAWSRLGLARFALGDAKGSMEAYGKGIEYEGNGGSDAMKKGYETAKKRVAEVEAGDGEDEDDEMDRGAPAAGAGGMPDLSALAGMFGGGGAGGAGGMPDLSSIMSNPMFASMAQNLMSNPDMMSNLMSNPRIRDMASQFGGGGGGAEGAGGSGGPDLSSLMSDPSIAEMARNMMGGAGRGAGRGAGGQ